MDCPLELEVFFGNGFLVEDEACLGRLGEECFDLGALLFLSFRKGRVEALEGRDLAKAKNWSVTAVAFACPTVLAT